MRIIGLTGGIGTGKSEVAAQLSALGANIIDADEVGHTVYRKGTEGWRRVIALFGEEVLDSSGEIDRKTLGSRVFGHHGKLSKLNSAIHPLIRDVVLSELNRLSQLGTEVVIIEAAVLFQAGWDELTDEVWVMAAPTQSVENRLMGSRNMTATQISDRLNSQPDQEWYSGKADVEISNSGDIEHLRREIRRLWDTRIYPKGRVQDDIKN